MGVRIEFDDARHELRATAGAPIAQGRELLFDYGATCKEVMVNAFGFAPAGSAPCSSGEIISEIYHLRSTDRASRRSWLL